MTQSTAQSSPNVVLFITHDTGRFVSPCGISTLNTPNTERLAREGVNFTNAFCTSPLCSPARSSLVTGRHPHQNGVLGLTAKHLGDWDLNRDELHAARLFKDAGYQTILCGFEHETRDAWAHGFEQLVSGCGSTNNGGGDLADHPEAIDTFLASRDADQPFFMQIGCGETHDSARNEHRFGHRPDTERGLTVPPYLNDTPEVREEVASLQGACKALDTQLGRILDVLDERGVADETIFVFTTDHGIDFPRAKGTFYDPGLETFLFMRYPRAQAGKNGGGWEPGKVCDQMISGVDVLATLLEACGLDVPDRVVGRSFLPLLAGGDYEPNEAIFAGKTYHDSYDPTRAVRTARYKYIRQFEVNIFTDLRMATESRRHFFKNGWKRPSPEELYDLQDDPDETNNLAADPDYQTVKREMTTRLARWMKATDDPLLAGPVESHEYRRLREEFCELAN